MMDHKAVVVKCVRTSVHAAWIVVRVTGRKLMRRRTLAYVGGVTIMYGSGLMIAHRPEWVDHIAWETTAFVVHGIGAIPFIKPFECVVETIEEVPTVV